MMALNRNNNFYRVCALPDRGLLDRSVAFLNLRPGRCASTRLSEAVCPSGSLQSLCWGGWDFVVLEADFLNSFMAYIS